MTSSARSYLWRGVQSNARVIQFLLHDLAGDSPRWDARPDPARFSLREVVAHLLDYDSVSRERFERIIREDHPELENWDETEAAEHYEARDPKHQIENLLVSRQELAVWLEGLSDDEWQRVGSRPNVGEFSVEQGTSLLLGHDAYHLEQIVAWLEATK
jgi:hypothetical protein